MKRGSVFLTGATGFAGSVLAAHLLRRGYEVRSLARSKNGVSASERVSQAIHAYDPSVPLANLRIFEGDIRRPHMALDPRQARQALEGVDAVLHVAATLRHQSAELEWILDHNVRGTAHLLESVAETAEAGCTQFFYVSTAYSCGKTRNPIPEGIHENVRKFNNAYEWSKARAEDLVVRASRKSSMPCTILRPGVLVGDCGESRWVSHAGYFSFIRAVRLFSRGNGATRLRIPGSRGSRIHLTPVDELAAAAARLLELPAESPRVVHVVPEDPPTVGEVFDLACNGIAGEIVEMVSPDEGSIRTLTPAERRLKGMLAFYAPYIEIDYEFETKRFRQIMGRPLDVRIPLLRKINASFHALLDRNELVYAAPH